MRILFLGDIVSKVGRKAVQDYLPQLREEHSVDLVLANAENLAGGRGVTPNTVDEMLTAGIDYLTSGNHVFYTDEWEMVLSDKSYRVLRPLNYPETVPGRGFVGLGHQTSNGKCQVFLVNLISTDIDETAENPFRAIDEFLEQHLPQSGTSASAVVLLDFHSERSSTKRAMGFYLDGRVSAVLGTHTHVPTADAQILLGGTAYVSDVGMIGPLNSILGVEKEIIIRRHQLPYPERFEWVKNGAVQWNSILLKINTRGKAENIKRLDFVRP